MTGINSAIPVKYLTDEMLDLAEEHNNDFTYEDA